MGYYYLCPCYSQTLCRIKIAQRSELSDWVLWPSTEQIIDWQTTNSKRSRCEFPRRSDNDLLTVIRSMLEIVQTSYHCEIYPARTTLTTLTTSRHRAATTGSVAFVTILLHPPEGSPKPRLNTGDRIGNTPLHLAMESGHGEVAVMLVEAGADRGRVSLYTIT
jgi:Ankyrin repeat